MDGGLVGVGGGKKEPPSCWQGGGMGGMGMGGCFYVGWGWAMRLMMR